MFLSCHVRVVFWVLICTVHLTVYSYHFTCAFQSESKPYSCLNIKELLARSRHEIWSLTDCNWRRTQNQLVHKRTLKHLGKLVKWLSCVLSTCLYGIFECMLSESRLYSCVNVKEPIAQSRREIWSVSDWNWIRERRKWHEKNIKWKAPYR